jgi:isoleucyl-tRNA synthetase
MGFREFEHSLNLPAIDREVLALWRERKVFARSLELGGDRPAYVFYEGPPTANGSPGVHHVEARAFKDLWPRFNTMRGHRVDRKGGWDCHGLPVELQIEGELGLRHKHEVEEFGVAEFNRRCREAVVRHVRTWTDLTDRIGYWVDTERAYWTMDPGYVESVWWALAELHRRGLLYEDYKVVPYCPRCGTPLSDAEVDQGYQEVQDPSVYVVFPVTSGPLAGEDTALLVWTTTPWTLLSNVAVAAGPGIEYVLVKTPDTPEAAGRRLVVARDLVAEAVGEDAEVLRTVPFEELLATTYQRPFTQVTAPEGADDADSAGGASAGRAWRVVPADYVTTTSGTGLVHIAPAYGAEDLAVGRAEGLPVLHPVDAEGRFPDTLDTFGGQAVKAADPAIVDDLRARGLLWRSAVYTHNYPHCWRCATPLLYYALTSWYARTTAVKERMLAQNAQVGWRPQHIRDGRFGDWLEHNVDWALSRARYWGTPLPLWRCPAGHVTAVSSRADLGARAGRDLGDLDPHRPYVDEITFDCPEPGCGATARRVPDVLDAWFDSGSMPFAQWGYPHKGADNNSGAFERAFPADFISEAIDQTRGWFYSLLAVNTLLFERGPYRNVVCLGHIVDKDGRKMSKSLGNVLDPFELLDRFGADPLRWFMLASGSPWSPRRLSPEVLGEITRNFFLTLWNVAGFFSQYARLEGFDPAAPPRGELGELDRWVLAELDRTVRAVTDGLEDYDPVGPAARLTEFVDDLSNWYVRLSRRRFWRGVGGGDEGAGGGDAAFRTLWTCLRTLSLLLAPYTPFVAEALWQRLVAPVDPGAPDSVHLAPWPEPAAAAASATDTELVETMALVRTLVRLGRQARTEAKIRVRQPLARALVTVPAERRAGVRRLLELVATELNVKEVAFSESQAGLVTYRLQPQFRALGPRFGKDTGAVAAAVRAADPAGLGARLLAGEPVRVEVPDLGEVELTGAEVTAHEVPVTGWRVVSEGAASVALDLELTPELRREGLARDLVRAVQELRKSAGLAVDDRIDLAVEAGDEVAKALADHGDHVLSETLALALHRGPLEDGHDTRVEISGEPVRLWLRRAG